MIKAIVKYRNHPSILTFTERCSNSKFRFSYIEKTGDLKKTFQVNKALQDSEISTTKLIENFSYINRE